MPVIHIKTMTSNGTVVTDIMHVKDNRARSAAVSPLLMHHSTELDIGET